MEEIAITVVVPIYNAEGTLDRCLQSLVPLVRDVGTVILVDDGSTDSSQRIAAVWAELHGWTLISQDNHGLGAARQVGLERTQSRYVCFVDSDDWINPNTWLYALRLADHSNADIVRCRLQLVWNSNTESVATPVEETLEWSLLKPQSIPIGIPGVTTGLYRLETLRQAAVRFPSVRTAEDLPFVYLSARASSTVIQLEDVGYYYVQGGATQLSKAHDALPEVLRALDTCRPEASEPLMWRLSYWRMYWRAVAGISRRSTAVNRQAILFGMLKRMARGKGRPPIVLGLAMEAMANARYIPRYLRLGKGGDDAWVRESHVF